MKNIMLDLETLGTDYNAAVVAIGACAFDLPGEGVPDDAQHRLHLTIDPSDAMRLGLTVNGGTIKWWLQQSDAARKQTFGAEHPWSLAAACAQLNGFLNHWGRCAVWGNGATFDNVIIRSAYKAAGVLPEWHFRDDKCYRTVINLLPKDRRPEFVRVGEHHNALDDAVTQAVYLQKVWKELGLG